MQHAFQTWIVAMLVPSCTVYAAWKLMPAGVRRLIAAALLRRVPHVPRPLEATLRRAARAGTGCACDGCDHAETRPTATAAAAQPITFHARPRV